MTGLPIIPLVALGLLFFASPLIVLVLILVLLSLRSRVRRLETRLAQLAQRAGAGVASSPEISASDPEGSRPSPPATPSSEAPRVEAILEAEPMPPAAAVSAPPTVTYPVTAIPDPAVAAPPSTSPAPAGSVAAEVGQWEGRLGGTWLSRVGA